MSSVIDICNLALSRLGDTATISSIDPPEGSAQAEHCATFYPIARDNLLELHNWSFSLRRGILALLVNTIDEWDYVYAMPSNVIKILSIQPAGATDDFSANGIYTSQPYSVEMNDDGIVIIYTDCPDAHIRYTTKVTDPTLFTPLFITTLSWHLAGMIAGPIIKGKEGEASGVSCEKMAQYWLGKASESSANQRRSGITHIVPWIAGR